MTIPKAAALPNNVITLSTEGCDSLETAINQFLLWEVRSRDCIKVKRCYIDVAQDLEAGVLLSQIIYWHLPGKEGDQKLTVQRDGYWWLAKGREDWWQECRLTPKQFDRAIRHLEAQQLVGTRVYKWKGQNTKHIRVNWPSLLQALSMLEANSDAVVGFRRRQPVNSASKVRNKETQQDSLRFPNSQSSELAELTNSQSSESLNSQSSRLPNSQSLDSLIGNSRIPHQGSSELTNREIHLYTETTIPKTTSKDYNSPPTPQEQECEQAAPKVAKVEVVEPSPTTSSQERAEQLPSPQPASLGRGDYSAAAGSACEKFEQGLKGRSQLPSYRTTWERNGIKQEFLNWMCLHVMASWSQYKHKTPTPYDAKNWVRNREKEGCQDLVENRYDQMLHEQAHPQTAQIINTQNAVKSAQGYDSIMQGLQLAKTGGIFR